MTKRELIKYTAQEQRKNDERHASLAERMATYDECKAISKNNGYGDKVFKRQIWDNAIRENAIANGAYRP